MSLNTSTSSTATEPFSAPWLKTLEAVDSNTINISGDASGSGLTGALNTIAITLADGIAATKIANGTVDNTEFQYLNGVTSSIQTQLNSKIGSPFYDATGSFAYGGLKLKDQNVIGSYYVTINNDANSNTADRTLSLNIGDANRTLTLSGNLTVSSTSTISGTNTGDQTITLSGDVTGGPSASSITTTLANSGVVAGTYNNVATEVRPFTVDAKGRITSIGTAVTITPSWSSITSKPTTLSGFGITDALSNSTTSTQSGYFGDIFLYDDSTPSHYLQITNSANLTALRTLSINVNDASRTLSMSGNLTVSSAATVSGTNTGDQTITLTGDVTGSGNGSFATTIANNAVTTAKISNSQVTYAKIQNVSVTDRILGRATAGAGVVEEIICTAAGRALIDDADATAQRTTLGLGTIATQASNNVNITGGTVNPTNFSATSAFTTGYFKDLRTWDVNDTHTLQFAWGDDDTANRTLTWLMNGAGRTVNLGGNLTLASSFTTSGANALTLTTTGATNVTLPTSGTLITANDNARVGIENNGTLIGTRRNINFIAGSNVTLTITDDPTNEEVDVTIASTGGGGGGGGDVFLANNNAFTGANTFTNSTGQIFRQAATQDGVLVRGRAGGTSNFTVELIPTTLTASRVLTLPNVSGTVITTGDTSTVTNTMLAGSIALTKLTSDTTTALGVGTLELGHATDTTLSRSAAGVLAVEGIVVPTISSSNTLTNKTIALGSNTVSGTKAQFDTAVTDDNFAYVGTANSFTAAQTITSTTANQLVVRYDASNAVNFAVSTAGLLTVSPKTGNMIITGANSGGWVLGEWTQASGTAGYAMMGHRGLSQTGYGNYAIYQTINGQTAINAVSGQELQLCNNNTVMAVAKSTGFSAKLIPAINSTISTNTITPNADVDNMLSATGLAAGLTIANHTGSPQNGQKLMIRLKDNGTSRALTWGTAYVQGGVALPTATTANKMTHLGFIYDTGAAKWMLIASVTET